MTILWSEPFAGADGSAPGHMVLGRDGPAGGSVTVQGGRCRFRTGTTGGYSSNDRVSRALSSDGSTGVQLTNFDLTFDWTPSADESYLHIVGRSTTTDYQGGPTGYSFELNGPANAVQLTRVQSYSYATLGTAAITIAAGVLHKVRARLVGSTLELYIGAGTLPSTPTVAATDSTLTAAGYIDLVLSPGNAAVAADSFIDNLVLGDGAAVPLDGYLLLEDGASKLLLEDGSGALVGEAYAGTPLLGLATSSMTLQAQPVTPTPGQVTITAGPATIALTAQPVVPQPQPVTVALQPATVTLTARPVVPTPAVQMQPASVQMVAQPVVPTPGAVNLALGVASVQLTARPVTPTPGVVQIALQPATVQLTAAPVTPTPQPVTVNLAPAQLTLAAQSVQPQASGYVALVPAPLQLEARPVQPTPQPVQLALAPAMLALVAQPVTVVRVVQLQPAVLALTAQPVVPTPGQLTVTLVAATVALTARPVAPAAQPVTVTLQAAVVTMTARPMGITLQPVQVQLMAAQLNLTARPVTPQPGALTVALEPAVLQMQAVAVQPVLGELEPLRVLAVARGKRWQAVGVASRPGTGTAGRYSAVGRSNRGAVGKHGNA